MTYNLLGWIKTAHITFVIISFCGFILRYYWIYRESPLIQHPFFRHAPHINDTLLFLSGITMAWFLFPTFSMIPLWFKVKMGLLILYILLGSFALRPNPSTWIQKSAFILSLLVFFGMLNMVLVKYTI